MTLSKNLDSAEYGEYTLSAGRSDGRYLRSMTRKERSINLKNNMFTWLSHMGEFVDLLGRKQKKGKRNVHVSFVAPVDLVDAFISKLREESTKRDKGTGTWTFRHVLLTAATNAYSPTQPTPLVPRLESPGQTPAEKTMRLEDILSLFPSVTYSEEETKQRIAKEEEALAKNVKEVEEWYEKSSLYLRKTRQDRLDKLQEKHIAMLDIIAYDQRASEATSSVLEALRNKIIESADYE